MIGILEPLTIFNIYKKNKMEETSGKKCKKCGEGFFKRNIIGLIIAMYMLFTSIYGTIQLIKNLF